MRIRIEIVENEEDIIKTIPDKTIELFRCPYCKKLTCDIDGHLVNCIADPLGLNEVSE